MWLAKRIRRVGPAGAGRDDFKRGEPGPVRSDPQPIPYAEPLRSASRQC